MHLKFFSFSLFFLIIFAHPSTAQQTAADTGTIVLVQDAKIRQALEKHVEINSKSPVRGYRIKIHFGADKARAREVKARFIEHFPDIPAYEKYDQPNFNIRVGDFRTKLEAYKALKLVQSEFPSSFIVQDDIETPTVVPDQDKVPAPESIKQNK